MRECLYKNIQCKKTYIHIFPAGHGNNRGGHQISQNRKAKSRRAKKSQNLFIEKFD